MQYFPGLPRRYAPRNDGSQEFNIRMALTEHIFFLNAYLNQKPITQRLHPRGRRRHKRLRAQRLPVVHK
jgi:hypothetical protein